MPPQSLLPPLLGLCFPPTQPTPAPRTSLDVRYSPPHAVAPLLLRQLLLLLRASASASASAVVVVVIVTVVTLQ
jgi:hypothetical protein